MSTNDERKSDEQQDETDDYFVWVDIETTGLEVEGNRILEVGYSITDLDLHEISSRAVQVWDTAAEILFNDADSFVQNMHIKNGLIDDCKDQGMRVAVAESLLVEGLEADLKALHITKPAMCGSSVHFDRGHLAYHMWNFEKLFSYRNIDNSTVKELCRRTNPVLYAKLEQSLIPMKRHRVVPDLMDTIDEYRFYAQNFLFTARGV